MLLGIGRYTNILKLEIICRLSFGGWILSGKLTEYEYEYLVDRFKQCVAKYLLKHLRNSSVAAVISELYLIEHLN